MFLDKFLMFFYRIRADSNNNSVSINELFIVISEIASFRRTSWCHIFRIEIQNNIFSFKILQTSFYTILVLQSEIWCLLSNINTHCVLFLPFLIFITLSYHVYSTYPIC